MLVLGEWMIIPIWLQEASLWSFKSNRESFESIFLGGWWLLWKISIKLRKDPLLFLLFRDVHVKRILRCSFCISLDENWVFFCLGMPWSNYKWRLEASYVYFQTPDNFWVTKISTWLEISQHLWYRHFFLHCKQNMHIWDHFHANIRDVENFLAM